MAGPANRTSPIDRAIAALYEAAVDPNYWTSSLALLTKAVGGFASTYVFADLKVPRASFVAQTDGYSADALRLYAEYYGALDEARETVYRRPAGILSLTQELFDASYVAKSEFINDFLIPQGGRYVAGTCLINDDRLKVNFGIHRSLKQGPFGTEQRRSLERILPHLTQATRLAHRINQLRIENVSLSAALDRVPSGIVLTGADGRVVHFNEAANALFAKDHGLSLRAGRLEAELPATTQALQKLIAQASSAGLGRGGALGGSLAIAGRSGTRLMVFVAPLSEMSGAMLGVAAPGAILFLADPAARRTAPTQLIAQAFGLTPAEARLAVALASGASLEDIAHQHELSKNTLRVQLQSVFTKTGTRRQAELATLVLGFPVLWKAGRPNNPGL